MRQKVGATVCAVAGMLLVAGCGDGSGGSGLRADDPSAVVDAWAKIACNGVEPRTGTDAPYAGVVMFGSCDRVDIPGTISEKRQIIWVFDSESARDTFMVGRDCSRYYRVTGGRWASETAVDEIATGLVDAGGHLCGG